jgi:hypothetical protein
VISTNPNGVYLGQRSGIFKSNIAAPVTVDANSHFLWNVATSTISTSAGNIGDVSVFAYNKVAGHACSYTTQPDNSFHFGNVRGTLSSPAYCTGGSDNVTSTTASISNKRLLVSRSAPATNTVKNQQVSLLPLIYADSSGFLNGATVEFDLSYEFDGTIFPYDTPTISSNEAPVVSFSKPECYLIKARSLNGSNQFMGKAEYTVTVNDGL